MVIINTSGNGPYGKVTFRLNGPDVSNITGSYNGSTKKLTFSGLSISVADGTSQTYTVNAYFNDNTGLIENQHFLLDIDGDVNVATSGGTLMSGTNNTVQNSSGSLVAITATQLAFTTQPAGSTSGTALTTQPVVVARDAANNIDADFTETVTLTESAAGTLTNATQTASAGVAAFSNLTYTATADGEAFTLTANDQDGVGTDLPTVNASATNADVVATQLVFTTQPAGSTSGSALTTQPVVAAQDANNITDTDFTETVTLTESAAGTLTNATQTASAGVATFANLTYTATADGEAFTLTANDQDGVGTDLPTVNASATNADVVATQLVFTTQPAGSTSGSALTTQPVVVAQDANNITDTGFTETITLTESAAGTLTNATQTASAGVATFANLTYTATTDGEAFTLTANDQDGVGTDLPTVNASATNADVVATQLVFTTQPAGAISGTALTTQPVVVAQDANNITDTGFTETITLTESAAGTLTNTTQTASAGVATFANLTYTATADGEAFTLTANDQDGVGTDLPTVNASATNADVVATQLVFTTQPAGSTSGTALTTQPVVVAQDANNITDTDFTETITLTESAAGTLTNATQTASAGVATFSNLTYTATADGEAFTLTANDQDGVGTDLPTVNASATNADVVATQLVFTTQPAPLSPTSGLALDFTTDPVVEARDAQGVKDTDFTDTVTLTHTGSGSATYTNHAIGATAGVATFTGLTLTYTAPNDGETFALRADDTAAGAEGDLSTLPTSSPLTADVVATQLVFTTQPTDAISGTALTTQPVVAAQDANNITDTDFTETITLTESAAGTLTNATQTASAGVATFSNLTYTATTDGEAFTLTANDQDGVGTDLPTVNASATNADVVATQLVFTAQPTGAISGTALTTQPVVAAQDANNITDTDFTETITLTESAAGTLTNATQTASAGVATFSNLTYTATTDGEAFTLTANDQDGVSTDLPTVNASATNADVVATQLVFTTQPAGSTSGTALTTQPVVAAQDANNITDTDFTETITLTESAAGTLTNATQTASAGVATFANLTYTATTDGEAFTLTANDQDSVGTDLPTVNASATNADVVATQLVFTTQPAPLSPTSGLALDFTTDPVVEARDAQGIKDTDFTDTVTLTHTGGGSATYTNHAIGATAGVATFTGLTLTYTAPNDGETFALRADDTAAGAEGDLGTLPTSSPLTADVVATQLVFTTQPAGSTSGTALTTQPVVVAQDANNITDTDFTETVTLTESAAGTLTNATQTASAGVATFANLTYTATADGETFTLTANDQDGVGTDLPTVNASATNADVVATQLVFTTQPTDAISGTALTTQPVVAAQDANNITDTDFTETITLTESAAGTLTNATQTASAGVATFSNLTYTATADGEAFTLTANDQDGVGTDLPTVNASATNADVVATQLVFTTQPAPLSPTSGLALDFTTDPVVEARDAQGIKDTDFTDTVTLTHTGGGSATYTNHAIGATAGVATFTGLTLTYTAPSDGETFALRADDTAAGAEGDLSTLPTSSPLTADVVATQLVFTTQPTDAISGTALTTQPVVAAQDANNITDTGFTETITLTESAAGTLTNATQTASAGVATFANLTYTATTDGEAFTLTANDQDGVGTDLPTVNASATNADVVATQLVFTTQPAPLSPTSGLALDFTTDPVVEARDAQGIKDTDFTDTVTLTHTGGGSATYTNHAIGATAGVATFTGLTLTYTAPSDGETFALRADDTAAGAEGDLSTLATSSTLTANTLNSDGALSAANGVIEPVALPSTATSASDAVDIFDFTIADGSGADGFALAVTQMVLNTSGTGPFAKVTFRLSGPDVGNAIGTYSAAANTLTFSSLPISVANGGSETYTVNAYYNDNTSLIENETFILSVDGDTDLAVSIAGSQMGATAAVTNATGTTVDITATQLVLNTAPADTRQVDAADEVLSGSAFQTQPVIRAHDAAGNLDADFAETITASLAAGSGQLGGTTSATASAGVATFADLRFDAASDGASFALSFDDQTDGAEGDLGAITSASLSADVVASQWVFTRSPGDALSGLAASIQPEVQARDARGVTDLDFTQTATLALNTAGAVANASASASAGVAAFSGLTMTGVGQGRALIASGGGIGSGTSASFAIGQALASVNFISPTHVTFDGQAKALTSATDPAGLSVVTTYNGSTTAPTSPGTYEVVATISDAIYAGTASGTLIIRPPAAPTAGLQASITEGAAPLTVAFTNTSHGFGHTFLETFNSANQTFDDPGTVEVTYAEPGTYEAMLTIKGQGGSDQARVAITVHGPPALDQAIAAPAALPAGRAHIIDLAGLDQRAGTWQVDLMGPGPVARTEIDGERVSFIPGGALRGTQEVKITRTNAWGLSTSQQLLLAWTAPPDTTAAQTSADPSADPETAPQTPTPPSGGPTAADPAPTTTAPGSDAVTAAAPPAPADATALNGGNAASPSGTAANTSGTTTHPPDATANTPDALADTAPTALPATEAESQVSDTTPANPDTADAAPPLANTDDTAPTTPPAVAPTTFFDAAGQPIYGLFDNDLQVEFDDFFLFVDHFGASASQDDFDPRFDLDGDGRVGLSDFFLFADNFGKEAVLP